MPPCVHQCQAEIARCRGVTRVEPDCGAHVHDGRIPLAEPLLGVRRLVEQRGVGGRPRLLRFGQRAGEVVFDDGVVVAHSGVRFRQIGRQCQSAPCRTQRRVGIG